MCGHKCELFSSSVVFTLVITTLTLKNIDIVLSLFFLLSVRSWLLFFLTPQLGA